MKYQIHEKNVQIINKFLQSEHMCATVTQIKE